MSTKELKALQEQIDQLTKRRSELESDLGKRTGAIADRKQMLASEMLAGRDTAKGTAALASESLQVDAVQEAIILADDELRRLKQECDSIERAAIKANFNDVGKEAYGLFLGCIDQLHEAVAILDELHAKLEQANQVGAPAGLNVDHDDHLRLVQEACRYLRGDLNSDGSILYRIQRVEQGYSTTVAVARARQSA